MRCEVLTSASPFLQKRVKQRVLSAGGCKHGAKKKKLLLDTHPKCLFSGCHTTSFNSRIEQCFLTPPFPQSGVSSTLFFYTSWGHQRSVCLWEIRAAPRPSSLSAQPSTPFLFLFLPFLLLLPCQSFTPSNNSESTLLQCGSFTGVLPSISYPLSRHNSCLLITFIYLLLKGFFVCFFLVFCVVFVFI